MSQFRRKLLNEFINNQNVPVSIPEGLITYLKLDNSDTGLIDLVNGNELYILNSSNFTWDETNQLYVIKSASYYTSYTASLEVNYDSNTFINNSYTVIGNFKVITNSSSKYVFSTCIKKSGSTLPCFVWVTNTGTSMTSSFSRELIKSVAVVTPSYRHYYMNDSIGEFGAYTPYLPNNWISLYDNKIYFGTGLESKLQDIEYCIKNLMIFNRELSENEINLVKQNYLE